MLTWVVPLVPRVHSGPGQCLEGVTGWTEWPSAERKEEEREKEKGPSFLPLQGHWPHHAAL